MYFTNSITFTNRRNIWSHTEFQPTLYKLRQKDDLKQYLQSL